MISWCKPVILLIAIIYFDGDNSLSSLAEETRQTNIDSNYNSQQQNYESQQNWLAQNNIGCQQQNVTYREVYRFETEDYYISICELENNFYYHRQSKLDLENSLSIPAEAVFDGKVFKATKGKTTYFVGRNGDRYYSSVMLNNNEIVFEPELVTEPLAFSQEIVDRGVEFSFNQIKSIDVQNTDLASTQFNTTQNYKNSDNSLICTDDRTAFNPNFDNWRSLLGKSTDVAHNYATDNGHNFLYEEGSKDRALIKTKEGTIVNLNISTHNEIIEQVCVRSTEDI
ncbi:hypothetical protein I4641_06595 [Waterburya agarophytonicola K14]|uniref:Uncharacterized protein n=1 Tax=Waterburya agarophytonicola KI4 TaxID=2874699 RepID=A0A964BPX5_9CYAN|nr:hypothetical protein [Waterburya agarophytonicola]MCC0176646.1 hypothetical protein [Waterburya agarophytonicola KI4]